MATNLGLDDNLINEAVKAGNHRTKREAVTAAVQEYVKLKRRLGLLEMVGQVEYEPGLRLQGRTPSEQQAIAGAAVIRVLNSGRNASSRVVVDTSVWSLAVRRRPGTLSTRERALVLHWADLVRDGRAALLGVVRQEVLTGIRAAEQFDRLRHYLRGFDDEQLTPEDFEEAARFHNVCRAAGITGSAVDFLVCAAAAGRGLPVFTTDPDFQGYAQHVPLRLYDPQAKP